MIAYLRVVPGFWVAVEERERPELRSRPLIIGGLPQQRGAVREANIPAQRYGIHPGMALSQAYQRCPEGIFLAPHSDRYAAAWEEVCTILEDATPLVEPVEMGQAVCDLSGCERLWGGVLSMARGVVSRIRQEAGIAPWLGLASNRITAQLASTAVGADGITVVEAGEERTFLADLPLSSLPDLDPKLALTFQVLGLRTIGQLAALPASAVEQRFGKIGGTLHRYARGLDRRPVLPPPKKPSVAVRHECEDGTIEEAVAALPDLAERCAAELEKRQAAGKLVELVLVWVPPSPPLPEKGRAGLLARHIAESGSMDASPRAPTPPMATDRREPSKSPALPDPDLPIPYRIHSMLPQPETGKLGKKAQLLQPARDPADLLPALPPPAPAPAPRPAGNLNKTQVLVRTPIATAPSLLEQAQRLLPQGLQGWEKDRPRLHALELRVSQFEAPAQLSFPELNRLDATGRLGGVSPERRLALRRQEEILSARHGTEPFRHVAKVDPSGVLTERRFHWEAGLPWKEVPPQRRRK